jgi:hypothetical protein
MLRCAQHDGVVPQCFTYFQLRVTSAVPTIFPSFDAACLEHLGQHVPRDHWQNKLERHWAAAARAFRSGKARRLARGDRGEPSPVGGGITSKQLRGAPGGKDSVSAKPTDRPVAAVRFLHAAARAHFQEERPVTEFPATALAAPDLQSLDRRPEAGIIVEEEEGGIVGHPLLLGPAVGDGAFQAVDGFVRLAQPGIDSAHVVGGAGILGSIITARSAHSRARSRSPS